MKLNRMLLAAALGTVLALSACGTDDVSVEKVEVSQSALGAGSGYSAPNTFNTAGLLATVGGVYNTQALGTPMELWMGVGNQTAG